MICLLNMPDDVLEKILSYITYDEVSRCRLVCRRFNSVSKRVLNRGFHKAERYHAQCLRKVKTQLPRRESERRKHPLARHSDILTAVETRLSLLRMTFMKFVDLNLCCFIPGKVLDEIYRVLRYITTESNPIRAHEVLQELRDLSSMAMEYFDEKIAPSLKNKECGPKIVAGVNMISASCHDSKPSCSHAINEVKVDKLYRFTKHLAVRQSSSFKEIRFLTQRVRDLSRKNTELEKIVMEQQNIITVHTEKISEQNLRLEMLERYVIKEKKRKNNGLEIPDNLLAEDSDASEVCANPSEVPDNPLEVVQANPPEEHINPPEEHTDPSPPKICANIQEVPANPPEEHTDPSPPEICANIQEVPANPPEVLSDQSRSQKRKLRPRLRPENNGGTLKKIKN